MYKSKKSKSIIISALFILISVIVVIVVGFIIPTNEEVIQGEIEVTDYKISSKITSRVLEIRVQEGDMVKKGDTLVIMEAPDIEAKLAQANAAYSAAEAIEAKAKNGARTEEVKAAFEMWQKSKAGLDVAEKTYKRVDRLFENGVMPAQKRDEAKAQYDAAIATEKMAKSQYDMAVKGARNEDKEAAAAQVKRAEGAVKELHSYIGETVLLATEDGMVSEIFPEVGELVGAGAHIMNIDIPNNYWFTFNVREDLLPSISVGSEIKVYVPALGKEVSAKISRVKNVGNFASWKATKSLDSYDLKVFEVRAVPTDKSDEVRSGMSVILKK